MNRAMAAWLLAGIAMALGGSARAQLIWVEGEKPAQSTMTRHPWWYDQVKKDQLSGGDFISNWNDKRAGEAEYAFTAPASGSYEFWVRANPVQARLSYRLNAGAWKSVDLGAALGSVNIALDGKIDLRFIAWMKVGQAALRQGANTVDFRMDSQNNNHGMIDCFVFSKQAFQPNGALKPGQAAPKTAGETGNWYPFAPAEDTYQAGSAIDLRGLNEKLAGDGGFIAAKGGEFVHSGTGETVRFWAVNGPSGELKDRESLRRCARMLAKRGVNLVRVHGGYFDENGEIDPAKVQHSIDIAETMKQEGIYSHFSIYFPLWFKPKADNPYLKGYDGTKYPFAALYFNPDFQKMYRTWWKALLTTPSAVTGRRLIDEPAVMGTEIINEDSYFFWTFTPDNIPDAELRILETQFGQWLAKRYGSIDAALAKWGGQKLPRDNASAGRVGFRPLWNMFNDKSSRDKDTVAFLLESQRSFYADTVKYLRDLGFKGVITCSNWTTASPEVFGPLEKYSYTAGDFIDRHGYLSCFSKGPNSEWSIQNGHTYADRSALRFDNDEPGKPKQYVHPIMDPHYNGMPSMISEVTWNRPNRYRTEGPLYLAAYGALQDSNAIVNFALDGATWTVKPGFYMQPWTLMSPTMAGQFPAAALIYRKGLVSAGPSMVDLNLSLADLMDLKGTPMPQDAAFDDLRAKDVPQGVDIKPGNVIDPLVHYVGRTNVRFTAQGSSLKAVDLSRYIDRTGQKVASATGELRLDYGRGTLTINAAQAQGVVGDLGKLGAADLKDLAVTSPMDVGAIVAVSLDGKPLATSERILLQVMSEEKNSDFATEDAGNGTMKITDIGHDPWLVRDIRGTVRFKRADAGALKVKALDGNGYPAGEAGTASELKLKPDVVYYLISK